nr:MULTISPECIES: UmuC protein [unclassified Synechocystis]
MRRSSYLSSDQRPSQLGSHAGIPAVRLRVKALGVKMGVPFFKIPDLVKRHNIQVFSSNYCLYGDLSHRIMTSLQLFSPVVEIYSIDEAFLELTPNQSNTNYGEEIQLCLNPSD